MVMLFGAKVQRNNRNPCFKEPLGLSAWLKLSQVWKDLIRVHGGEVWEEATRKEHNDVSQAHLSGTYWVPDAVLSKHSTFHDPSLILIRPHEVSTVIICLL